MPISVQSICDAAFLVAIPLQNRGSDAVPVAIPAACRCDTAVPCLHLCSRCAKLPAPQGSHYSVTAGERSEPAEGACPHHHRPQGGRTLVACACECPALASLGWQLSTGLLPWQALQSVCLFDPLGAVHIYMWLSFRGFAMLTRGYRVVRPPWGRLPRRHSAAKSRERRLPRRHPGSMSLWYRCPRAYVSATHPAMLPSPSPSPQHVAVIPRSPCLHRCSAPAGPRSPYLYLCSRCAKLPAPQGSHYSVTAGERSEPAEGACPHHHRPQGGRTLIVCVRVCRVPASLGWQLSTGLLLWLAVQVVCLFDPLGAVHICVALLPRVRHAHPRLQSSSAPLGPPSSSPFRCKIAGATLSLPSSRQHVVVVPRFPCLCRCNASAGPPSPSPSRQHVAVIPPSPCLHLYRHSAKLPAPQGSHYSIAAGSPCSPAEGACPHHHRPQGGRTLIVCVRVCRVPASLGWQLSTGLLLWLAVQAVCLFDPLGAVHIYMALLPRVRHAHPRLQSSSAPLGPPSPSPFRCKIAGATSSSSSSRSKVAGATPVMPPPLYDVKKRG